ncbi:hypothetical protein BJ912DRAFT_1075132 [Pholiota molesta]|nr:hypothetical protein BJ912DRAFT_1075132 [Pholiota molesta]
MGLALSAAGFSLDVRCVGCYKAYWNLLRSLIPSHPPLFVFSPLATAHPLSLSSPALALIACPRPAHCKWHSQRVPLMGWQYAKTPRSHVAGELQSNPHTRSALTAWYPSPTFSRRRKQHLTRVRLGTWLVLEHVRAIAKTGCTSAEGGWASGMRRSRGRTAQSACAKHSSTSIVGLSHRVRGEWHTFTRGERGTGLALERIRPNDRLYAKERKSRRRRRRHGLVIFQDSAAWDLGAGRCRTSSAGVSSGPFDLCRHSLISFVFG